MTDMRATERLLEVIGEQVARAERELVIPLSPTIQSALTEILAIAHELRRRGDTLVRRDDLRTVVEGTQSLDWELLEGPEKVAIMDARDRLEIALGGKLR